FVSAPNRNSRSGESFCTTSAFFIFKSPFVGFLHTASRWCRCQSDRRKAASHELHELTRTYSCQFVKFVSGRLRSKSRTRTFFDRSPVKFSLRNRKLFCLFGGLAEPPITCI